MEDLAAEDDGYSDDDLDALPDQAFHEIQQNAIQSTLQPNRTAQAQLPTLAQPSRHEAAALSAPLGRLNVGASSSHNAHQHALHAPSSDYGDFDDEMLDGEILDAAEQPAFAAHYEARNAHPKHEESIPNEHYRPYDYGPAPPYYKPPETQRYVNLSAAASTPMISRDASRFHTANDEIGVPAQIANQNASAPPVQSTADVATLQDQVLKLLNERETLQQAVQNANDNAFSKAGEIAIVRANANKVDKEFETRTKALQKLHAEEIARQKIEVEKVRAELQKIATEKKFLENDLTEGTKRIRNLQRATERAGEKWSGSKAAGKEHQPATPRKNKTLPHADGFDDDEIQSPSKLVIRSKANTPRVGAKRKRKPTEGRPMQPSELTPRKHAESFDGTKPLQRHHVFVTGGRPARSASTREDSKFKLTQKLMDHRFAPDEQRTYERLATFAFPSNRERALSTILLDKMATLTSKAHFENFPAAIGVILISLWSQCMEERYHQPVHLLVDLVKLILLLNPVKTAPDLVNDLMNLVLSTADVILVPRCKKEPPRKDRANIDSTECLQIMQMMAYDCSCDKEEITRFWRTMRFDFIMMLLNFINPLEEIHIMLSMLHTSILERSFAMIVPPNNGQQDGSEAHIIDNLSLLLVNSPRSAEGQEAPDAVELCEFRLQVLSLIEAMLDATHSAEALAKHRLVIGCLIRVMNDELDRVYDYRHGHEQRIALVNASTRLLYHLTSNYPHLINMQARLSVIPGGEKKFLIALTRLAFSEGGFYEQGIEDDVVDCAHQMLEARVSPEEAEQLVEAFSSAPVSRT